MALNEAQQRTIRWLANGETGISSKMLAFKFLGVEPTQWFDRSPPRDPADLRRCMLFLRLVPEARGVLQGDLLEDPDWGPKLENWDELEALLVEDIGMGLDGQRAQKTYDRMKELEREASARSEAARKAAEPSGAPRP